MKKSISIFRYSQRTYLVFGDTRAIKDELKRFNAKFNHKLRHPVTGKRIAGWILFPAHVDAFINWAQTVRCNDIKLTNYAHLTLSEPLAAYGTPNNDVHRKADLPQFSNLASDG